MSEKNKQGLTAIGIMLVVLAVFVGLWISEMQAQSYLDHYADDVFAAGDVDVTGQVTFNNGVMASYIDADTDGMVVYTGFGGDGSCTGGGGVFSSESNYAAACNLVLTPSENWFKGVTHVANAIFDSAIALKADPGTAQWLTSYTDDDSDGTADSAEARFSIDANGKHSWGSTGSLNDLCMERTAANELSVCSGDTFKSPNVEVSTMAVIPTGAYPPATCTAGAIFIDTDETDDTNCTTTADNSLCLCTATDTWTALENN